MRMLTRWNHLRVMMCPVLAVALAGCGSGLTLGGSGDTAARNASSDALSGGFPNPLSLTDDQRAQARDIFQRMHDDIQPLREQAHTDMRNVLTTEQQTAFDQFRANHPTGPEGFGPPAGPFGGARPAGAMAGRFGGGMGPGFGGPPPMMGGEGEFQAQRQAMFEKLAEELGLTEDQKAQIKSIQETLHTAVEARRHQALDELKAILTAEQLAQLETIEANRPV